MGGGGEIKFSSGYDMDLIRFAHNCSLMHYPWSVIDIVITFLSLFV